MFSRAWAMWGTATLVALSGTAQGTDAAAVGTNFFVSKGNEPVSKGEGEGNVVQAVCDTESKNIAIDCGFEAGELSLNWNADERSDLTQMLYSGVGSQSPIHGDYSIIFREGDAPGAAMVSQDIVIPQGHEVFVSLNAQKSNLSVFGSLGISLGTHAITGNFEYIRSNRAVTGIWQFDTRYIPGTHRLRIWSNGVYGGNVLIDNIVVITTLMPTFGGPDGEAETEPEGEYGGEGPEDGIQSADTDGNFVINLSELLRLIQICNFGGYHCAPSRGATEDGFIPDSGTNYECAPHDTDYNPQDWDINLSELLRIIQIYAYGAYRYCPGIGAEDDFCLPFD